MTWYSLSQVEVSALTGLKSRPRLHSFLSLFFPTLASHECLCVPECVYLCVYVQVFELFLIDVFCQSGLMLCRLFWLSYPAAVWLGEDAEILAPTWRILWATVCSTDVHRAVYHGGSWCPEFISSFYNSNLAGRPWKLDKKKINIKGASTVNGWFSHTVDVWGSNKIERTVHELIYR